MFVGDVRDAITYEKRLKRWRRDWKIRLLEDSNPHWEDLYLHMMAAPPDAPCAWVPDSRCAASGMTPKLKRQFGFASPHWASGQGSDLLERGLATRSVFLFWTNGRTIFSGAL